MGRNLSTPLGPELARLMSIYQVTRLDELATKLGVPYSTVRNWHVRGRVPERYTLRAVVDGFRSDERNQFASPHIDPYGNVVADAFAAGARADAADDGDGQPGPRRRHATAFSRLLESTMGPPGGRVETPQNDSVRPLSAGEPVPQQPESTPDQRRVPAAFDPALLTSVIRAVSEQLESRNLEMPGDKFAELIVLIYEHLATTAPEHGQVARTTERYLRLVA